MYLPVQVNVDDTGSRVTTANVYQFTAERDMGASGTVAVSAGAFSIELPARSATLVELA